MVASLLGKLDAEAEAAEAGVAADEDVAMAGEGEDAGGGGGDGAASDEAMGAIATTFSTTLIQYAIVAQLSSAMSVYDAVQSQQFGHCDGDPAMAPGVKVRTDGRMEKTVTVNNFTLADLQQRDWRTMAGLAGRAVDALVSQRAGGVVDAAAAKQATLVEVVEGCGVTLEDMREAVRVCKATWGRGVTSIGLLEVVTAGTPLFRDVLFSGDLLTEQQLAPYRADRSRMITSVVHSAHQLLHLRRHCPRPDGTGKTMAARHLLPLTSVPARGLPPHAAMQAACSQQHHAALSDNMPPPPGGPLATSYHSEITGEAAYVKRGKDGTTLDISKRPLAAAVLDWQAFLRVVARVVEESGACEEKLTPSSSPPADLFSAGTGLVLTTAASDIEREADRASVAAPAGRMATSSTIRVISAAKHAARAGSLAAALSEPVLSAAATSSNVSPVQLLAHVALAARLLRYTTNLELVDRLCGVLMPDGSVALEPLAPLWRAVYTAERAFSVAWWTDGSEWESHKAMAVSFHILPTPPTLRQDAAGAVAVKRMWEQLREPHVVIFHVGDSSVNAVYLHRAIERAIMAGLAGGSGDASEMGMHRVKFTPRNGGPTRSLEVALRVWCVGDTPAACIMSGVQQQGAQCNPLVITEVSKASDVLRLVAEGTLRELSQTDRVINALHAAGQLRIRNEAVSDRVDVGTMPKEQLQRVGRELQKEFGVAAVPLPAEGAPTAAWRSSVRAALGGVNAGNIFTFNQPVSTSSAAGHGWPAAFVLGGYSHALGRLPGKLLKQVILRWGGAMSVELERRMNVVTGSKSKDNTSFTENMRMVSPGGLDCILGDTPQARAASLPQATDEERSRVRQLLGWLGDVYRAQQQSLEEATSELQRLEFIGLVIRLVVGIHALFPLPIVHGSGAKTVQGALYGHYWIYLVFAAPVIRLLPGCMFDELRFERGLKGIHGVQHALGSSGSHGGMAELARALGRVSWAHGVAHSDYGRTDPARAATTAVQCEQNRHRGMLGQRVVFPAWTLTPFLARMLLRFTPSNIVAGQFSMTEGGDIELHCGADDVATTPVTYSLVDMTPACVDAAQREFLPAALAALRVLVPAQVVARMQLASSEQTLLAMGDPARLRALAFVAPPVEPPEPQEVDETGADDDGQYVRGDEDEDAAGEDAAGEDAAGAADAAGEGEDVEMDGAAAAHTAAPAEGAGDGGGNDGGGDVTVTLTVGHVAADEAAASADLDDDPDADSEGSPSTKRVVHVGTLELAAVQGGRLTVIRVNPLVLSRTRYPLPAALSIVASAAAAASRGALATTVNAAAATFFSEYLGMRAAQKAGGSSQSGLLANAVKRLELARAALTSAVRQLDELLVQSITFMSATSVRKWAAHAAITCTVGTVADAPPAASPQPLLVLSEVNSAQAVDVFRELRSLLANIRSEYELWLPGDDAAAVRQLVAVDEDQHTAAAAASQQAIKGLVLSGSTRILPHGMRPTSGAARPRATAAAKLLEKATSSEAELASIGARLAAAERALADVTREQRRVEAAKRAAEAAVNELRAAAEQLRAVAGARGGGGGSGGGGSGGGGGGGGGGGSGRKRQRRATRGDDDDDDDEEGAR